MAKIKIKETDALIVVDVQNDFCPGGALAVKGGDKVVPVLNGLVDKFSTWVYTRDWHPPDHISFAQQPQFQDKSWPVHCVRHTKGAEFHPELRVPRQAIIVNKAESRDKEAYSGFQDTGLAEKLQARGIKRVFVGGLATDYCVKNTVLDALAHGFAVVVIEDGIAAVDVPPGSGQAALEQMQKAGAKLVVSAEIG